MDGWRLLFFDGVISFILGLLWLVALALARWAFWPELDARWVLGSGPVIFALVFGMLAFFQGANGTEELED